MLKKLCCCLIFVLVLSCASYAGGKPSGLITKAQMTESEYKNALAKLAEKGQRARWEVVESSAPDSYRFYKDIPSMLLALDAGEIDRMVLTRPVAEYIVSRNPKFRNSNVVALFTRLDFVFGFMNDDNGESLRNSFNKALRGIKADGTLDELCAKYIEQPSENDPETVKFASFKDSRTLKVAVTGDVPPIDFTAADGTAAGFNTAILAEIGKRIECNIEIIHVDASARIPALSSGRADVVFWFELYSSSNGKEAEQLDLVPGIIVSDPYYGTDLIFNVSKR